MGARLAGKRAVIIGAGQTPGEYLGNGRAMALMFAREGACLYITALHKERAEETAALIRAESPEAEIFTGEMDASCEMQVKQTLADAAQKLGGIDILVNNVGIMLPSDMSLMTADEATIEKMTAVNERSALYLLRNIYGYMKENGGAVVQIASIAGVTIGRDNSLYKTTKAAMIRLGEMFASTFAKDGIRVNTIVLGRVCTSMAITFNMSVTGRPAEQVIEERDKSIPLKGGQGSAWDTAAAALFLASDESKFITGAKLPVDGGATIGLF